MITFMVEPWSSVWPELQPHWNAHWEEVAVNKDKFGLDIDFEAYADYERRGCLHVVVARDAGKVIGYHLSIVRPHLHYKQTLNAFTDVYYIAPPYRKGSVGIKLFREVEKTLKARGVVKMFTGTKLSLDRGRIFEHLGWSETERLYTKWIGD